MTAIAHVGIADTSTTPTFTVATIKAGPGSMDVVPSGIFCIGALPAPDGQLLYLSLIGRDTALQEFRGKLSTGKLTSFVVQWNNNGDLANLSGWFSREWLGQMEYNGSRLQTDLFGEVTQMILYHPLLTTPDKANQTAALPVTGAASDYPSDLWNVVKHVCDVPLLDGWRDVVLQLLMTLEWFKPLSGFGCHAGHVKLGNIAEIISANVRSGALCADGSADKDKLTLDPDYGRASPEAQPTEPPQGGDEGNGFWDDAEIIDTYSRAQAIADGVLVDVSDTNEAREAGFRVPVALTADVWARYAEWESEAQLKQRSLGQSTAGRLWDILYMASMSMRAAAIRGNGNTLLYKLHVIPRNGRPASPREITLKIHSGAGDHGEHVITIMLPHED